MPKSHLDAIEHVLYAHGGFPGMAFHYFLAIESRQPPAAPESIYEMELYMSLDGGSIFTSSGDDADLTKSNGPAPRRGGSATFDGSIARSLAGTALEGSIEAVS